MALALLGAIDFKPDIIVSGINPFANLSHDVTYSGTVTAAMEAVQRIHVSDVFMKHTVEFVRLTRTHPSIELGCSPRAGLAIVQASRARAFVQGRDYVVPEDLFELAEDVVLHRIRLSYEALAEGQKSAKVLEELLKRLG